MVKLEILASGSSTHAQAQARGKLFEKLMAEVLRSYGYDIDKILNVNYAGMEIDIEGKTSLTNIPLYAECKFCETQIEAPKIQAFYGKYMARWQKNRKSQGIFIALPGLNSYAKGYYCEYCEGQQDSVVKLIEEEGVLEAIFNTKMAVTADFISKIITDSKHGKPGDSILLYTDRGLFWAQYVIPLNGGIPDSITIFDAHGGLISDIATIEYLTKLYPSIKDFKKNFLGSTLRQPIEQLSSDEIVEVRGGSSCFEYQFPASPPYFVGRQPVLAEIDSFLTKVINKQTSLRGLLFEANSGWGKSSVVLASVARLRDRGHFAVAIDSRSASSSQFILRVIEYTLKKFGDFGGILTEDDTLTDITGFDGAVKSLIKIGKVLESKGKVLFIFFDQFENMFFQSDALKQITDLLLKVCDAQTGLILGFSWKTDLIGATNEFPYKLRDSIRNASNVIVLDRFSEVETTALLDKLSNEIRARLRKDLRFLLSDFSQGYPWLLKKLCAHVKAQREAGVLQADMADKLLNVEELFKDDMQGLTPQAEEALKKIAKAVPISISELGDEFAPEVVQSLVDARLIVRIGTKYDIYWDIFRDYLNSGRLPVQERYILRIKRGSVINAIKLLNEMGGITTISSFQEKTGLSKHSFYNIMRDLRLLGIAKSGGDKLSLIINLPEDEEQFESSLRDYLRDKLQRNLLVWRLIDKLKLDGSLDIRQIAKLLADWCPYISASNQTWETYAYIFADWIDATDLGILDIKKRILIKYAPGEEIRERSSLLRDRRVGHGHCSDISALCIRVRFIEAVAIRIAQALRNRKEVNWNGLSKNAITKALRTLEFLGFINRKSRSIYVQDKLLEFVDNIEKRSTILAENALKMRSFSIFIDILKNHSNKRLSISHLSSKFNEELGVNWSRNTSEWVVKIMLDWARFAGLAPIVYKSIRHKL